ncbi:LuxR C-terminal-related transcriptional regulator [Streptomyces sp. URMC 129]|uniref:helix-turn-helix transcriptional regulator n=1 Tax=Streptomyces sp. URMC 129 TaxID=3423407 RepID=UPI003F1E1AB0
MGRITAGLHAVTRTRQSKVLTLETPAGTGKTRLLIESIGIAVRHGFGVVSGVVTTSDALLAAVPTALDAQVHRLGTLDNDRELRARLRDALERGQALVVLDDLHLAELPALAALGDLIAQSQGHPVLWILASGTAPGTERRGVGDISLGGLPLERLPDPGPLTGQAVADVVADHLGAVPDPSIVTLAESVGTTPRAVIDLARGLIESGEVRVADGVARLRPRPAPPAAQPDGVRAPAPVPACFAVLVRERLRELSPFTLKALRLAAVLGSSFTPTDLAALLGESPPDLLAALDEAIACGLVSCGATDFAFRSEALWRVVLDSVPPPMCALLHRQAAAMLLSRPDGVEAAALHVAHIAQPGDMEAVRIIGQAAGRLLAAEPATAASLAARGMLLLAPDQDGWLGFAATAMEGLVRAGTPDRAVLTAQDAEADLAASAREPTAECREAAASFRSWLAVALLLEGRPREAGRAAREALTVAPDGSAHGERAELCLLTAGCLTGPDAGAGHADRLLAAGGGPPPAVRAGALTVRALGLWRDGEAARAIALLREAEELDRAPGAVRVLDPRWFLAVFLTRTGAFDEALGAAQAAARTCAEAVAPAVGAILRAPVHLARGRLAEADEDARAGLAGGRGTCLPLLAPHAWRVRALVALRRGRLGEAAEHLDALDKDFPHDAARPWRAMRALLTAEIAEAKSGPAAALDSLAEVWACPEARRELLLEDPWAAARCVRWALDAGRMDLARGAVATAEALRERARDLPAPRTAAAHARAVLDGDAAALARTGPLHTDPWAQAAAAEDLARLLLARGEREGAVGELERALNVYGALGGERDGARVRRELRHLGVRRRHWTYAPRPLSGWDSLTKAERQVAELVAGGLTNRQVAGQLFVSPHTVGFHLRQIYRKLGLRSRIDLIRLRS